MFRGSDKEIITSTVKKTSFYHREGAKSGQDVGDDRDWFKEQYATKIGTPFPRPAIDVNAMLKNLFLKRKYLKESKFYAEPVIPKTTAQFFKWPFLMYIKKCLCGDVDCICKGSQLSPPESVPHARRKKNSPAGTLVDILEANLTQEVESYILLQDDKRSMDAKSPEFCGARCISFKIQTEENTSDAGRLNVKLKINSSTVDSQYILKQRRLERGMAYETEHAHELDVNADESQPKAKSSKKHHVVLNMVNEINTRSTSIRWWKKRLRHTRVERMEMKSKLAGMRNKSKH